ncbi:MAG: DUF1207 domain-containing protein [Gemmatimonadales bacterium]
MNKRFIRAAVLLALTVMALPQRISAQIRFFPSVEPFEYPVGSLRPSGTVGRVIWARLPESRFGVEQEADVSIGENLPVLGFGRGDRPAFLGLTIRVSGRFSLDDSKSALISNDWLAGIHAVADRGPWRLAAEVFHESSHLGDEYADRFGDPRVDWTREVLELSVRRRAGRFAASAEAAYAFIDELELPPASLGIGADYAGDLGPIGGGRLIPVAGVHVRLDEYADWKATTTAKAGLEAAVGGRRLGVGLILLDGLSTQRQFFRVPSRYVGFELRFDW